MKKTITQKIQNNNECRFFNNSQVNKIILPDVNTKQKESYDYQKNQNNKGNFLINLFYLYPKYFHKYLQKKVKKETVF